MRDQKPRFYSQVHIILLVLFSAFCSNKNLSAAELQYEASDQVSIYADRAYRQNEGKLFQAIGNVVILSGKDTLYGETVSYNVDKAIATVEGNVRLINKQVTLYGSNMEYDANTKKVELKNARIVTPQFNLVASEIKKISENVFFAKEAEFTTCKDCVESWSIYGAEIQMILDQYVIIRNGLIKVKGANLIYLPWIALPIKQTRQSGLLFPQFMTIIPQGIGFQQPYYWAIDDQKDLTFAPTFWAKRGNGADFEYRQMFGQKSWLEMSSRTMNDSIYLPNKTDLTVSNETYFRHFSEVEMHGQWTNDITQHFRFTGLRDLDIVTDQAPYVMDRFQGAELGMETFVEGHTRYFSLGVEGEYNRNVLFPDPEKFDKRYIQILPKVYGSTPTFTLFNSSIPFLQNISMGMDADYTVFRQMQVSEENGFIRNAARMNSNPYVNWNFTTWGPFNLKSKFVLDRQDYTFFDKNEDYFSKQAGILKTEFSFVTDRIFGLAYEQKIPITKIEEVKEDEDDDEAKPVEEDNLIGDLPEFKESLNDDYQTLVKFSYRHSQEYKLIHHFITGSDQQGNEKFRKQIESNVGWFDYTDAERRKEQELGLNTTRLIIPPANTLEFQWNNTLTKKAPKYTDQFVDKRFLSDNFTYTKLGNFNVSQGVTMQNPELPLRERLTRLYVDTTFNSGAWRGNVREYYFHQNGEQFFDSGVERKFELISLLTNYNFNSLGDSRLRTLKFGTQIRPIDVFGFSVLREFDLDAGQNVKSIYQFDFMPHNNCWIFNVNFWQTVVDSRISFNVHFNFGDAEFAQYRNNFFSFARLK